MRESTLLLRLLPLCSAVVFGLMRLRVNAQSKTDSLQGTANGQIPIHRVRHFSAGIRAGKFASARAENAGWNLGSFG
jgi:hypothetical protein